MDLTQRLSANPDAIMSDEQSKLIMWNVLGSKGGSTILHSIEDLISIIERCKSEQQSVHLCPGDTLTLNTNFGRWIYTEQSRSRIIDFYQEIAMTTGFDDDGFDEVPFDE